MPEKTFIIWLNAETRILVYRVTDRGRYVSFAVILTILSEEGWTDVGRFDTAHGIPHRDILGKEKGLLQKIWYDDLSPRNVFHLAISTFKEQYRDIIEHYDAN